MSEPMPPRFNSTERVRIQVQISCEKCGHTYTTTQEIVGSSRHDLNANAAAANAHTSLEDALRRIRLGDCSTLDGAPCPQCGHEQSWMLANRVRSSKQIYAYGVGALVAVLLLVLGLTGNLGESRPLAVAIALLGGIVCFLLARLIVGLAYRKQIRAAGQYRVKLPTVELAHPAERSRR